jgi:3-keto-disaccharide hydrolase
MKSIYTTLTAFFLASQLLAQGTADEKIPEGFVSLFNGKDLANWKIPAGDNGHWKVLDAVIDYDAESEAKDGKDLWSAKEYKDFVLYVDWRIKETPWKNPRVPLILPSGLHKLDENGKEITMVVPDSDSGILLRGTGKCQANIWCWPIGSGEVYGYRMDESMPPEVRRGVTPKVNADKNIGEWNRFIITMKGDRMTVVLNGITVIENALLPDIPPSGPIGLQHHGSKENGEWVGPPSLVQFRRIYIKEL